jgi:hypothetical protein
MPAVRASAAAPVPAALMASAQRDGLAAQGVHQRVRIKPAFA